MTDTTGHSETDGAEQQGETPETVSKGEEKTKPWLIQPGEVRNPNGRPKGSRNKASQLLDQLGQDNAKEILQAVINRATKDGDNYAANLVLNRVWPARKSNPVQIELPTIESAADVTKALDAVLAAVAAGEIDPDEAVQISSVLEIKRRSLELFEIEQRIAALESKI
jgi:hypothetical protein